MERRTLFSFTMAISCASIVSVAQDIHFTQINSIPLMIDPALTGMTDGRVRANMVYRNQWQSIGAPFVAGHVSVDGPVYTMKNKDYIGGGLLLNNTKVGDGSLKGFTGALSASYHKFFGKDSAWLCGRGSELSVGIQAGYTQATVNLSALYFGGPQSAFTYPTYSPGFGNSVNYFPVNSGLTFSQGLGKSFNYIVGFSVHNISQPSDALLQKQNSDMGFDRRYTAMAGGNIVVGERLILRPAFVYIDRPLYSSFIGGNEFMYDVSAGMGNLAVFAGMWYRTDNMVMINTGIKVGGFRVGLAYDYRTGASTVGGNGFEVALTYAAAKKDKANRVACNRF